MRRATATGGAARARALGAIALAALLAPPAAVAHDFWLERDGARLVVRHGHRGGELLGIDRAKLKAARCLAEGTARDLLAGAVFAPTQVELAGGCRAASAFLDGGFYALTPDGEVNLPKNQVPAAVKGWASRQYAKWVDARSREAGAVFGDELEIVPVTDLSRARTGSKVTVRVLHRGDPAPGAVVAIGHQPLGETDRAGEARVKVRASGVETIGATLRRRVATPEADAEVLEASLSFEVAR